MAEPDAYRETLERMEPDISFIDTAAGWASIAISLKRIADSLERITTSDGISDLMGEIERGSHKLFEQQRGVEEKN
jgi:hypothetical protein